MNLSSKHLFVSRAPPKLLKVTVTLLFQQNELSWKIAPTEALVLLAPFSLDGTLNTFQNIYNFNSYF